MKKTALLSRHSRSCALALCAFLIASTAFAQSSGCPDSVTSQRGWGRPADGPFVFEALRSRIRTRAQLEGAYKDIEQMLADGKAEIARGGTNITMYAQAINGLYGPATGNPDDQPNWFFIYRPYDDVDTITPVLKMYECHRAANWPTATDAAGVTSGPAAAGSGKGGNPPSGSRKNPAQLTARVTDGSFQGGEQATRAHEMWPKNAFTEQQQAAADSSASTGRKVLDLPTLPACLHVVDAKRDGDVRDMYWFKFHNSCKMPIQAFWMSTIDAPAIDMLVSIEAGQDSELAWTKMPDGQPFRVKGIACPATHLKDPVYLDHKRNQCWAWS